MVSDTWFGLVSFYIFTYRFSQLGETHGPPVAPSVRSVHSHLRASRRGHDRSIGAQIEGTHLLQVLIVMDGLYARFSAPNIHAS